MKKILFAVITVLVLGAGNAHALGECGLSCCIASATGSGVILAEKFGVSLVYEYSYMETIRDGDHEVSPNEAISRNQQAGQSYKVPTEMVMQKFTLVGVVPLNERLKLIAYVPYVKNDMEMRMRSAMGMTMDMTMGRVSGIGDVSLFALYTLYTDAPIRPTQTLTAGLGVKTPTGSNSVRSSSGALVHAMMQPGSGSWDPLFLINYMKAFYPLVLKANLFYQLTTEGSRGYEFGDQLTYDLAASLQAHDYLNIGVEFNGIHSEADDDHDGEFSNPATSMADNTANTGLDSLFVSPVVQVKIPKSGGSGSVKLQFPVYQDVRGFQQVVDWRLLTSLTWIF